MAKSSKKKVSKGAFSISISFGKNIYSGAGSTALEALQSTPIPIKITTKGVVSLTDGEKSMSQMWQPVKIKRLFYKGSQVTQAKHLSILMK